MAEDKKSPAFQFYVQDFLSGVKFFSAEETGAYVLLLCEQWDSGFIEKNDKVLKKITGISPKKLQKVLEKFEVFENKLMNLRLEEERKKKEVFLNRASEGGKNSAKKRAEEKSRSLENKYQLKSKSSSSTSSSTSNNSLEASLNFDFVSQSLKLPFETWVRYNSQIGKPFTAQMALEACYKNLREISGDSAYEAIKIVNYSMGRQYKSLCKPDEKSRVELLKTTASKPAPFPKEI